MSGSTRGDAELIYGRNPVLEAIAEGKSFERIYLRDNLTGPFEKEVRGLCKTHDIPLKKVPQIKLDKLAYNRNHQGIVGFGSIINYHDLGLLIPFLYEQGINPFLVLLDNVQDVRNIGAIARSAEAFGCHGLILSGKASGMVTSDSIKTSAGALSRIHVCRQKNTIDTLEELRSYGIATVGTVINSESPLYNSHLPTPICLVIGSEGKGLHHSVVSKCDTVVSIPQEGPTESLNVSVAVGILLYEVARQLALVDKS